MSLQCKDLIRTLGSLETHILTLNQSTNEIKQIVEAVKGRISALERQSSFWQGGFGVGLALIAVLGNVLTLAASYLTR